MINDYINNGENLYVSDKVFIDNFKNLPLGKNGLILSEFFNIEGCTLFTKKGDKQRKLITPNKEYFKIDKEYRDNAFASLCEFLRKNNRPVRDSCIFIPPSKKVIVPRKDFTPLDLYYKEPTLPSFNTELSMIEIEFSHREEYDEVCLYSLGDKDPRPDNEATYKLFFSSFCFCGFILHY